ncbi:hypothetical protein VN12_19975 [Pirellula sp. SH-Sr6A]|uniref:ATP-binding protein n=1 Tax=Pirellula sp. SH-Sr6A TaxID=1632865 RepID=UPI00078D3D98|nr:ATP-binding protein [Pirellula sp. SH-Sr6A]AMV34413.1 hypothetical protein VN12_19975 [Pirellula sp. SH-Sr6A]
MSLDRESESDTTMDTFSFASPERENAMDGAQSSEPSYLLTRLEVFNWGPFRGMHRADFDPIGTAIIGPTGSGKTTLVDALMTLLVAQPRYNLASTGGHESDRTLVSYVRGVLGGDGSDGREEVARPGKTITGICATYQGGTQTVRLGGLLWTEGTGNSAEDLKKRWIFSLADDQSLEGWIRMLHDDGVRDLLKMGRETANIRFFDSKRAYLTHIRKFFDVGENAFTLLNRAAGLKQLNSIDEIFRELVLDDRSAFDRAIEVAAEFDNLAAIHAELETAKKQVDSLIPVAEDFDRLQKARHRVERQQAIKRILPIWFASQAKERWNAEVERMRQELGEMQIQIASKELYAEELKERVEALRERYLELGGNVISELENTITLRKESVEIKRKYAGQYQRMMQQLSLPVDIAESEFAKNRVLLQQRRIDEQQSRTEQQERTLIALSQAREQEEKSRELEQLVQKVQARPGSNIPPPFQDFRADLATQLGLRESDLPYLAELVEVKASESNWRGAIERAIGSDRLRILVPTEEMQTALRWVNQRDNRLHVRLQEAGASGGKEQGYRDGYVAKLQFKDHPLAGAAKQLLVNRDLHCVDSPDALRRTEHAMTIQGLQSGRKGKFEKQDQRRLDQDWMTGFDNRDQLEFLHREWMTARQEAERRKQAATQNSQSLVKLDEQLQMLDSLLDLDFSSIDLPRAESELAKAQERLAALLDPNSDASQSKWAFEKENWSLEELRKELMDRQTKIGVLGANCSQAELERDKAAERVGNGLLPDELQLAETQLNIAEGIQPQRLDQEERRLTKSVDEKLLELTSRVVDIEQQLIRKMEVAKRVDTGALADFGSAIEDVPHYLDRLKQLQTEGLPEKRGRFLEYLNRSSDQGVTQLIASIDEEVDAIEQRIKELNQTLVKVDFRSGRYLQLQPQRIRDERLRSLDFAVRKVRSAALKEDGGESHYKALQEMVTILRDAGENRRLQGSRALLDARFRLQFFVVEVDRQSGDRSPPRTGSQSGSGGEKELMASHILTASLSYALCPAAATKPLYATVVLDEAFSKSSPSAASRIIEALRIFSLHPIFVTPNKEIGLLKQHTRKVICVQRPKKEASLASITWERLESIARPK